jgi:hypothetical protein
VRKDPLDDRLLQNRCDELQLAAAAPALLQVDVEARWSCRAEFIN